VPSTSCRSGLGAQGVVDGREGQPERHERRDGVNLSKPVADVALASTSSCVTVLGSRATRRAQPTAVRLRRPGRRPCPPGRRRSARATPRRRAAPPQANEQTESPRLTRWPRSAGRGPGRSQAGPARSGGRERRSVREWNRRRGPRAGSRSWRRNRARPGPRRAALAACSAGPARRRSSRRCRPLSHLGVPPPVPAELSLPKLTSLCIKNRRYPLLPADACCARFPPGYTLFMKTAISVPDETFCVDRRGLREFGKPLTVLCHGRRPLSGRSLNDRRRRAKINEAL
jgi:hypothetical protein